MAIAKALIYFGQPGGGSGNVGGGVITGGGLPDRASMTLEEGLRYAWPLKLPSAQDFLRSGIFLKFVFERRSH